MKQQEQPRAMTTQGPKPIDLRVEPDHSQGKGGHGTVAAHREDAFQLGKGDRPRGTPEK